MTAQYVASTLWRPSPLCIIITSSSSPPHQPPLSPLDHALWTHTINRYSNPRGIKDAATIRLSAFLQLSVDMQDVAVEVICNPLAHFVGWSGRFVCLVLSSFVVLFQRLNWL